ncbi:MAG TPA: hypothetical protein VH538_08770 [Gaiellaceae bacterium]
MSNDVIARLAAANPVPAVAPRRAPAPPRVRRSVLAAAVAAAVAVPAVAFAGQLGSLLGIANEGSTVPTSSVLQGQSQLDEALQEMNVGSTMQALGTLNGVAFYAKRNDDGDFCLAIDHVAQPYLKGVMCDWNSDNFPSADVKALSFPRTLQGVAADGVATVAFLDAAGNVLDSTPVVDNLFASEQATSPLAPGAAAYLETLDANGDVLTKQALPG